MATGVTVSIGTEPDLYALRGISGYAVNEESTPVDPTDTTGATGSLSVGMLERRTTAVSLKRMYRKTILLEDQGLGSTKGIVRTPSAGNRSASLSADLRTSLLVVDRTAQPFNGMASGYVTYLLGLVGITSDFVIDSVYTSYPVTCPGWQGNVWLMLKAFASAVGAEVTLASSNIVFREVRQRVTVDRRDSEYAWSVDDTNLALSVEGYVYNNQQLSNALAYPKGGWNADVQVYQVDANETITFNIPIEASLPSVQQPTAQDNVTRQHSSSSVYCVTGADGLPITAAQWNAKGGKIVVSIGEDTRSLNVTITGANITQYAPFRIAATAGPSDTYSSLRIVGTGVFYDKTLYSLQTAISSDLTSTEVGATIDNEWITSLDQLWTIMTWTASRFSTPRQTVTVRSRGINRASDNGSYAYPSIEDFNEYATFKGWSTIANFNSNAGSPPEDWDLASDFNEWWLETVTNSFANQAFGNIAGARTFREGLWFRIRRATIAADGIGYTAENDTTVGDFNDFAAEQGWTTIADFNAAWASGAITLRDFNVAPLLEGS